MNTILIYTLERKFGSLESPLENFLKFKDFGGNLEVFKPPGKFYT